MTGKVYIIGSGPGDPELLTLKALECLRLADVVIYDQLVGRDILSYTKEKARLIYAGKKGRERTLPQAEINSLLVREAREGYTVARLKGGDPFLFGRGAEEAEALADADIPFEIVSGVTSAIAVPAYAGIPLTHRRYASTVAFVTGQEDPSKEKSDIRWDSLAGMGTLVFLMGVRNLPLISARLLEEGKDPGTPAALISFGTTSDQETLVSTLADIVPKAEERDFPTPSVLVVGNVVDLRQTIRWFENKPLFGKGIVITRPKEQAGQLAKLLRDQGAKVISFPTIKIVPSEDWQKLDQAIAAIGTYQWIIFTSANSVQIFFGRMKELGRDVRDLKGLGICTIGPATACVIEDRGIRVDLMPDSFVAEAVVKALQNREIAGQRILLPRAEIARDVIPDGLSKLGAEVDVVTLYRTVSSGVDKAELEGYLKKGEVDIITFTSPSTVKYFKEIVGRSLTLPSQLKVACIGPVTAKAALEAGIKTDIMREPYTIPGMVEAMVDYYRKEHPCISPITGQEG